VITLLFFLGGDVDPNADYVEPVYTNAMINLMYACFFLTALLAVVSAVWQFVIKLQSNKSSAIKTVVSIALTVLVLVIGYFTSSGESITLLGSGEVVDEGTIRMVDMMISTIYVMMGAGFLLMILGPLAKKIK
jgi:hypothetical protein